jgi:hypothetical protein
VDSRKKSNFNFNKVVMMGLSYFPTAVAASPISGASAYSTADWKVLFEAAAGLAGFLLVVVQLADRFFVKDHAPPPPTDHAPPPQMKTIGYLRHQVSKLKVPQLKAALIERNQVVPSGAKRAELIDLVIDMQQVPAETLQLQLQ